MFVCPSIVSRRYIVVLKIFMLDFLEFFLFCFEMFQQTYDSSQVLESHYLAELLNSWLPNMVPSRREIDWANIIWLIVVTRQTDGWLRFRNCSITRHLPLRKEKQKFEIAPKYIDYLKHFESHMKIYWLSTLAPASSRRLTEAKSVSIWKNFFVGIVVKKGSFKLLKVAVNKYSYVLLAITILWIILKIILTSVSHLTVPVCRSVRLRRRVHSRGWLPDRLPSKWSPSSTRAGWWMSMVWTSWWLCGSWRSFFWNVEYSSYIFCIVGLHSWAFFYGKNIFSCQYKD